MTTLPAKAERVVTSVIERMLAHTSPLFAQFERFVLARLAEGDIRVLVSKSLPLEEIHNAADTVAEIRQLAGGHPFDIEQSAPMRVPRFSKVERYRSPDGQIELDALAESESESWISEVKWRQKRVGLR